MYDMQTTDTTADTTAAPIADTAAPIADTAANREAVLAEITTLAESVAATDTTGTATDTTPPLSAPLRPGMVVVQYGRTYVLVSPDVAASDVRGVMWQAVCLPSGTDARLWLGNGCEAVTGDEARQAVADLAAALRRETLEGARERTAHQAFRDAVRDRAITEHKAYGSSGGWCLSGLNDALEELGLEEYVPSYSVSITVDFTADVEADSEQDARQKLWDAVHVDDDGDSGILSHDADLRSSWH